MARQRLFEVPPINKILPVFYLNEEPIRYLDRDGNTEVNRILPVHKKLFIIRD